MRVGYARWILETEEQGQQGVVVGGVGRGEESGTGDGRNIC